jgi:hypothetical protein
MSIDERMELRYKKLTAPGAFKEDLPEPQEDEVEEEKTEEA